MKETENPGWIVPLEDWISGSWSSTFSDDTTQKFIKLARVWIWLKENSSPQIKRDAFSSSVIDSPASKVSRPDEDLRLNAVSTVTDAAPSLSIRVLVET